MINIVRGMELQVIHVAINHEKEDTHLRALRITAERLGRYLVDHRGGWHHAVNS